MNMRKRLLTNLTLYDSTSKRLAQLTSQPPSHPYASPSKPVAIHFNHSQDRLLKAIITRAAFFLRDHMSLIRSIGGFDLEPIQKRVPIGKPSSRSSPHPHGARLLRSTSVTSSPPNHLGLDPGSRSKTREHQKSSSVALRSQSSFNDEQEPSRGMEANYVRLNVLLEQERLVEAYLEEANSRRQLEDAASLKTSLDEL